MDLDWFGIVEYYALIITVWFGLIVYLLVTIIKTNQGFKIKENIGKFKFWWKEHKRKKEEKHYN